jgi:hypothetical protein
MDTNAIVATIDAEIQRLQDARALLTGDAGGKRRRGRPEDLASGRKKRRLSPEARAKIAAAQKARWAKAKKASK